jgi:hypothetical protein
MPRKARVHLVVAMVVGLAVALASGLGAAALVVGGYFEGFLAFGLLGGSAIASVLLWAHTLTPASNVAVRDPFARDRFTTDIVNVAHIRVAGVGGFGLVIIAAIVALQFELITAAMIAGIVGGIALGLCLIAYRRLHRHA